MASEIVETRHGTHAVATGCGRKPGVSFLLVACQFPVRRLFVECPWPVDNSAMTAGPPTRLWITGPVVNTPRTTFAREDQ